MIHLVTLPVSPAAIRKLARGLGFGAVSLLALVGCATNAGTDAGPMTSSAASVVVPVTTTSIPAQTPMASTTTVAPVAPPATAVATPAIMPAVVCMNLQEAQDAIQAAGVFFSRSSDATGKGRAQIMDRNWVVVGQDPAPGAAVGEGQAVLSVVKYG